MKKKKGKKRKRGEKDAERRREGGRDRRREGGEAKETKILAGSVKDGGIQLTFLSDKYMKMFDAAALSAFTVYVIRSASVHR